MASSRILSFECTWTQCSLKSLQKAPDCSNTWSRRSHLLYMPSQHVLSFALSSMPHKRRRGTLSVRSQIDPTNSRDVLPNKDPGSAETNQKVNGTRLSKLAQSFWRSVVEKFERARRRAPLKLFSLLFGYYSANALSTLVGQTGDWDVLVVGLAVALIEAIGFITYRLPSVLCKFQEFIYMVNYWKLGLSLGFILDKFKLEMELPFDACYLFF